MIYALIILAAVALGAPLIAVVLVSLAIRREDRAWTLGDPPAGRAQVAARQLLGFYSVGIEWLPRADGSRGELISPGARR